MALSGVILLSWFINWFQIVRLYGGSWWRAAVEQQETVPCAENTPLYLSLGGRKAFYFADWTRLVLPSVHIAHRCGCATSFTILCTVHRNQTIPEMFIGSVTAMPWWEDAWATDRPQHYHMPQLSNRSGLACRWHHQKQEPLETQAEHVSTTQCDRAMGRALMAKLKSHSPWAIRAALFALSRTLSKIWRIPGKLDVSSCQFSPLQRLLFLYLCERWGVRGRPLLASVDKRATSLFILATLVLRRVAWHHELSLREKRREMMEGERFGRACMAANLLHMEEMAFPCKMCFSSCLSCTDDDESQHAPPFVSASSFLSLQGRETANRHQGREYALILSAVPLVFYPISCYF